MEKKPTQKPKPSGKPALDSKDAVILQQMEVIRSMTEHNLRRMGADFFGAEPSSPVPSQPEKGSKEPEAPKPEPSGPDPSKPETEAAPPEPMDALLKELDSYIGLDRVKKEVRSLVNLMTVHRLRREHDLPEPELSLHMVFTGNPGTGKTTIARLMARIYRSLGILPKGQLVEVDRGGLVAGYVGQTAVKTGKVIESALGGVLFIDEAYALAGRGENDFGQEAIDTLLKAMEDRRGEFIVIAAGYDALMDRFIHANPGLESRFNRFLHFEDYTTEELLAIFRSFCEKGRYVLPEASAEAARRRIAAENGPSFANARGVRNLFEEALVRQADRLAGLEQVTREQLMEIAPEDLGEMEPPAEKNEKNAVDNSGNP